jgi:hypothetical protein
VSKYVLTIDRWHPVLLNQWDGRHWAVRARLKRTDRKIVGLYARMAGIPPAIGKRRVSITLTLGPRQRGADPDGYWKSALGALAHSGLLLDDRRQCVEIVTRRSGLTRLRVLVAVIIAFPLLQEVPPGRGVYQTPPAQLRFQVKHSPGLLLSVLVRLSVFPSPDSSVVFPLVFEQFVSHIIGRGLPVRVRADILVYPLDIHKRKGGRAMDKGGRSYRFNLRVSPDWMARVRSAAEQRGISMADFVIMVVNERLGVVEEPSTPPTTPANRRAKKK